MGGEWRYLRTMTTSSPEPRSSLLARYPILLWIVCASLLGAACGSDSSTTEATQPEEAATTTARAPQTTAAPTPAAPDFVLYDEPGPYAAGKTQVDLDGRDVLVWYPADPDSVTGAQLDVFEMRDLLPEALQGLVSDELNPEYETDAYLDVAASADGPFPLVVFAHGFAGYPTEYQFLLSHLATWGFVVAGPDFSERGLLAAFTGGGERADETAVMLSTRDLMVGLSEAGDGVLSGAIDAEMVGTIGHSAGVAAAIASVRIDEGFVGFIAMSGGGELGTGFGLPTDKPGMVLTGGEDQVAELERVRGLYDSMTGPRDLVVIDEAGHNSFTDLCLIGADQGGILSIAEKSGIAPTESLSRLFLDGCSEGYPPAEDTWPVTRHFATAFMLETLGSAGADPTALQPGVEDNFSSMAVTFEAAE